MARFDVFSNSGAHAHTTPYLLDVQSELLDDINDQRTEVRSGNAYA